MECPLLRCMGRHRQWSFQASECHIWISFHFIMFLTFVYLPPIRFLFNGIHPVACNLTGGGENPACLPSLFDILQKVHAHFLKKIVGSGLKIPIKGRNLQEALYKMPKSQREADTSLSSPFPTGWLHCFSAVFVSCVDVLDTDLSRTAQRVSMTESAYRANP